MTKTNQSKTVYSVNDESVSREKFETLLKTLTEVEGTRTSGESPRGAFFSYRARGKDAKEYLIRGDGPNQTILGPLP